MPLEKGLFGSFGSAAGVLLIGLNATGAAAEEFTRFTAEEEFRALAVGKTLVFSDEAQIKVKRKGKMTGTLRREPYEANWAWRDGFLLNPVNTGQVDQL